MSTNANTLSSKADNVGAAVKDLGNSVACAAKEQAKQVQSTAADLYESGQATLEDMHKQGKEYVKNEPVKALLIAGAVGVVLGWLVFSRK